MQNTGIEAPNIALRTQKNTSRLPHAKAAAGRRRIALCGPGTGINCFLFFIAQYRDLQPRDARAGLAVES